MPYGLAGNSTLVRDEEACYEDYQTVKKTASYLSLQQSFRSPKARQYVSTLLSEAADATKGPVGGKLAVVTGVALDGVAHHVAMELALQADMHVMVMGKSTGTLKKVVRAIRTEALRRKVGKSPVMYHAKYHLASFESIREGAMAVKKIAGEKYNYQIHVLVNLANVGTSEAKLTQEKIEYNVGCNWIGTHYFTSLLLPYLQRAAGTDEKKQYKPRIVNVTSACHVLGDRLDPTRLVNYPKQGGAPRGFIIELENGGIQQYEPPEEEEPQPEQQQEEQKQDDDDYRPPWETPPPLPEPIQRVWDGIQQSVAAVTAKPPPPPDVSKVGTQVGRSKMGILADSIHLAKLHPDLSVAACHPGSIAAPAVAAATATASSTVGTSAAPSAADSNLLRVAMTRLSPSQGARPFLRAALDPDFNTVTALRGGVYLHANGNPWTPGRPATKDPRTDEPYEMEEFAKVCYHAAETLVEGLVNATNLRDHMSASAGTTLSTGYTLMSLWRDNTSIAAANTSNNSGNNDENQRENYSAVVSHGGLRDRRRTGPWEIAKPAPTIMDRLKNLVYGDEEQQAAANLINNLCNSINSNNNGGGFAGKNNSAGSSKTNTSTTTSENNGNNNNNGNNRASSNNNDENHDHLPAEAATNRGQVPQGGDPSPRATATATATTNAQQHQTTTATATPPTTPAATTTTSSTTTDSDAPPVDVGTSTTTTTAAAAALLAGAATGAARNSIMLAGGAALSNPETTNHGAQQQQQQQQQQRGNAEDTNINIAPPETSNQNGNATTGEIITAQEQQVPRKQPPDARNHPPPAAE